MTFCSSAGPPTRFGSSRRTRIRWPRCEVASQPLRIFACDDCLRQFLDGAVLAETSQVTIQKHLLARPHPQNGACARRGRTFDDPWIAQVFGEEIVKGAEHIRMDKQNRPPRCGSYAGKIFWSAGTRVDEICFESARLALPATRQRRLRAPGNPAGESISTCVAPSLQV